ncbi:uncharacterized protein A4U43_C04F33870 [Asparagus officinalis]|uniref:Glucosamine/galactosamine-6-phosphate isomerase domain-containing protein n=1 Tax=Asparagus officinalis TaxID=4686 RepID=A0A5P1F7E7_ASPOF|nr:uncharacterized protein A4U43_C04F33870 [Asparagus officinalis]
MARESRVGDQALLVYPSEDDVAAGLAGYTAKLSEEFAKGRGAFTVVLSGGYLINCLRYVYNIKEVPVNAQSISEKNQVYAINDTLSAEGAADDYEECLKKLVKAGVIEVSPTSGFPRFDLMLLGMGPDGHLASLFPHHPLLKEKKRWVTFIKDSPKPPPVRITFTFPVIDASAYIAMVVVGNGEVEAVRKALGPHNDQSDLLPVQMVSLENGEFTWFTDKEATSELPDLPNP